MAERNDDVLKMIAQLKARLSDLESDVRAFDGDLPDLAKRLDHIDDRIYLMEVEIESRAASAAPAAGEAPVESARDAAAGSGGAAPAAAAAAGGADAAAGGVAAGGGAAAAEAAGPGGSAPAAEGDAAPAEAADGASGESGAAASGGGAPAAGSPASGASDDTDGEGHMNILTPEAKAKLGETVGDLREIGRTGAETLSELNEAFSDITAPFKSLTRAGRRRKF